MTILPKFNSVRRQQRNKGWGSSKTNTATNSNGNGGNPQSSASKESSSDTDRTLTYDSPDGSRTKAQVKRATRTRLIFCLLSSLLFLISFVFLILVCIGNVSIKPVLKDTYFLKLDLSNIIPQSVPNAVLINSIARTLGLHDFYQAGLWNFCEGYNDEGVTSCSDPESLYWFNPVDILLNELLSGATIALPANIQTALNLAKTASHVMFGFFISGTVLCFLSIFLAPFSVFSRWAALGIGLFTFIAALLTTVATVIATVMFKVFQNVFMSATDINIIATLGPRMFAFMWIATGTAVIAWLFQAGMCCCCASRRDVRTGRKRGSRKAYLGGNGATTDPGAGAGAAAAAAGDEEKQQENGPRKRQRPGLGSKKE
ncbi:hypothetical protein L228DRAFT_236718 [Xylona heveae TC161]|uniref:Integral membrane protein n=1 Tax=Xylona heveae (strain CBS 132557 / TC161) TaxID=1328760 RepID=A0A165J2I6_XYLHT|nr:hypothetical protein L228DRAFT_236718 [Xylona heveae TC161]KZF25643.1 hypothetical protein L228DRAFT_236718 [Xylona heveae TC161]